MIDTIMNRNVEQLIEKHRPTPGSEDEPAGDGQLHHLNQHGLIFVAIEREVDRRGGDDYDDVVISKQVAWEVLAEAQRNGLVLRAKRHPGRDKTHR